MTEPSAVDSGEPAERLESTLEQRARALLDDQDAPRSDAAECAVLGALLLSPKGIPAIDGLLRTEDFSVDKHRTIHAAISRVLRAGVPVDGVLIAEELAAAGKLEEVGGAAYLASLATGTFALDHVEAYATLIRKCAALRELRALGNDLHDKAVLGADVETLRAEAASGLRAVPSVVRAKSAALDWAVLAGQEPPPRVWDAVEWFVRGHPHLISGMGGAGKSKLAQQLESCFALPRDFIGSVPAARKVLAWHCEDDADEIWRTQQDICRWLDVPIEAFAGKLTIEARPGRDNTLMALVAGRLVTTPAFEEFRQQANDLGAQVFIGDNLAHLFGGDEKDRHQTTTFVNLLMGALPAHCTLVLLGHVARAQGSEFSGSAAWENAVRARFYLGRTHPDQPIPEDDEPDDAMRYFCKRKANYTALDWRKLTFDRGVFVPAEDEPSDGGLMYGLRRDKAERVILDGLRTLAAKDIHASDSDNSKSFLPRLLMQYKLADGCTKRELADAMRDHLLAGRIARGVVGKYANRSPKEGLILCTK